MLRRLLLNPLYRFQLQTRNNSNSTIPEANISLNEYQKVSDTTLENLSDKLESILDDRFDQGADVSLNNGVLTIVVDEHNTYVINKQTPNKQIWLSSPLSGPKRFDFLLGEWIEKHSKIELKKLLSEELSQLLKDEVKC